MKTISASLQPSSVTESRAPVWLQALQYSLYGQGHDRLLEITSAAMKDCGSGIKDAEHYRASFELTGQWTQEDQHKKALR